MTTYRWNGGAGVYTTGTNWSPSGVPGADDTAIIATGAVSDPQAVVTGGSTSAVGSITLSGSGTTLTTALGVIAGNAGVGSLLISNGGVLANTGYNATGGASGIYATIGSVAGASGQVVVTGSGSAWNSGGNALTVGNAGAGSLTVENSGLVTSTYALAVGQLTGGTGSLTVQTGGTVSFGTTFVVGNQSGSFGAVSVLAGSSIVASTPTSQGTSYLIIGQNAGAGGVVDVTGAGALLNLNGNGIAAGQNGAGTLNVSAGASVVAGTYNSMNEAALFAGRTTGSEGTVNVDGAGTTLTATGYSDIGRGGEGTLTITDSAKVTVGDASNSADIGGGQYSTVNAGLTGGHGDLQVNTGGIFDAISNVNVGTNGSTGSVEVSGGGVVETGGQIGIGDASSASNSTPGTGTVTVGPGGTFEAGLTSVPAGLSSIFLGTVPGAVGVLLVEGAGALVNANGYRIGIGTGPAGQTVPGGTGFMTVSLGARAQSGSVSTTYTALNIGTDVQSEGTLVIENVGSTFVAAGEADIGLRGKGHVGIHSGGTLTTGSSAANTSSGFVIAKLGGASGDVTVADSGSNLTNTGVFQVGGAAVGTLTVEDGGGVTTALVAGQTGDAADIAASGGSDGSTVLVTGAGSAWTVNGTLGIGIGGNGSLTINEGGQVNATDVSIGGATGITGNLTLTANDVPSNAKPTTGLKVSNSLDVGVAGYGAINLGTNTELTIVNAFNVGLHGTVVGNGVVDPAVTNISGSYTATGTLVSKQVNVTSTGVIAPSGGTLTITGAVDGQGALVIGAGDGLVLNGPVNTQGQGLSLSFTGPTGLLEIADLMHFNEVVTGYQSGDTVMVYDPTANGMAPTSSTVGGNTQLTFADGGVLTFAGMNAPAPAAIQFASTPPCFCAGTLVAVADGEVAVEMLRIGDVVRTADGSLRPVRWIGRRSYAGRLLRSRPEVQPVRIRAGALGGRLPRRDLVISPEHAMFISGVLVPASSLVNGTTITRERCADLVEYIHIELEQHDLILAEGALTETFVDDDSRMKFHNASEYHALYPEAVATPGFCAPRVSDGYELEVIRQRLAAISAQQVLAA